MSDKKSYPTIHDPLYKKIADRITGRIRSGEFLAGSQLPSINAVALQYKASRESVVAAFRYLLKEGVVASRQGKGYFVREEFLSGKKSVLVLLDKFSPHQQTILDSFIQNVGSDVDVTIRAHYQSIDAFSAILDKELGRYDWYLLFPHFPVDDVSQAQALLQIYRLPQERLILIDRLFPGSPDNAGASYQSIECDIPETLAEAANDIRAFGRMRFIPLSVSLYGTLVDRVIREFCVTNDIPFESLSEIPETINRGDVFFLTGSRLDQKLVALVKRIQAAGLSIGKDVGIICYNDFPLNELILGGLSTLSTDFAQMGREAAKMISEGRLSRIRGKCRLIRRNTF